MLVHDVVSRPRSPSSPARSESARDSDSAPRCTVRLNATEPFSGLPVPPATPTERIITEDRKIIHRCKIPVI